MRRHAILVILSGWFVLAGTAAAQPGRPIATEPAAGGAWADGVSEANQVAARERFTRANNLMDDALFPHAAELYREALTYWDHPAIHYNLALALLNLDQPVALAAALEKARAYGPAPLGDERYQRAGDYLKLVAKLIAPVELTLAARGATLVVDGQQVLVGPGTWKGVLRAGCHDVRAYKEGYMPAEQRICLTGGEPFALTLTIYTDSGPTHLPYRKALPRLVSYSLVSAGLMVGFGGAILSTAEDNDVRYAGYTGIGAGATLAVVGVTLLVYERTRWRPIEGLAIAPRYDGNSIGLAAASRF